MLRWIKRIFNLKDVADLTKEYIEPCEKETKAIKQEHDQEMQETIKVLNKLNKEMTNNYRCKVPIIQK